MDGKMHKYDKVAATLHWLMAAMMIVIIIIGIGGKGLSDALGGIHTMSLHKSLGITVFFLALLRLFWRLSHTPPPLPETTPVWQQAAAHVVHIALYVFMLGMPILGYVFGSGGPYPMEWFGIAVPKIAVGKAIADAAHEAHEIGGWLVAGLVSLHIVAALWHHYVQRDGLLVRMRLGSNAA